MRLKIATSFFLVLGLGLLASWPWLVGPRPAGDDKQALREYAVRFGIYVIVSLTIWFVTAVLAVVTARRARQEFREQAMENLQHLLEETMKDHGKRQS